MNLVKGMVSVAVVAALVAGVAVIPAAVSADDVVDQTNENTGFRSRNTNRLRLRRNHSLNHTNVATSTNSTGVSANTGNNDQEENTNGGNQDTGNVGLVGVLLNDANANPVPELSTKTPDVDVDQTNDKTGARSRNRNYASIRNRTSYNVTNVATLTNTVSLVGNTGDNDQNKNTDAGDQTTGNVTTNVNLTNLAN